MCVYVYVYIYIFFFLTTLQKILYYARGLSLMENPQEVAVLALLQSLNKWG